MTRAFIERWMGRLVLLLVLLFSLWFVASEWGGFSAFGVWLSSSVAALPASIQTLLGYYTEMPGAQVAPSLVIGALVGGALIWRFQWTQRRITSVWMGLAWVALGAGLGVISAQLFAYTTRHCTFAPDAEAGQFTAGILLTALLSAALPALAWIFTRVRVVDTQAGYFKGSWVAWLLLAPTLLSLLLFLYYPSIQTVTLSLSSRRFPLPQERFVCLGNYASLAGDLIYQNSFVTTLLITVLIVVMSLALSLSIAVLASQKIRGASIYRTLLIWPFALSPVVAGVVFLAMFREGGGGLVNYLTGSLLGVQPSWLRDPTLARWVIVLASVWNILGFNILFYIAGLQNIPKDLLEAASIDGANRGQRFLRITFPLLAPFTFFLLVTNVTYAFYGVYGAVDTLTQGGPPIGPAGQFGGATDLLIYKLYQDAFNPGSPAGMAAAQALVLFVMVAGLTLLQFRYVERRITYSG
jgi:sn-glycerol 3-phosphate transport system permease protein